MKNKPLSLLVFILLSAIVLKAQLVVQDGADVCMAPFGNYDPQSEIHISVDKNSPNNLILTTNTYDQVNSYIDEGYYYNNNWNNPNTWYGSDDFPNSPTITYNSVIYSSAVGDPSTAIDANGNEYITSMHQVESGLWPTGKFWTDNYILNISNDHGATWNLVTYPTGISLHPFDKNMTTVDDEPISASTFSGNFYCIYNDDGNGAIDFSCLPSGATAFNSPYTLMPFTTSEYYDGANIQTGPKGEVFACWASYNEPPTTDFYGTGFYFSENTSGGAQGFWTTPTKFISSPAYHGIDFQGPTGADNNFGGTRVNSFPSMAVDKSCGQFSGRVYVAYPDYVDNQYDVIEVSYLDPPYTGSWTTKLISPTESFGNHSRSFFPWITVDDVTGLVCVDYYNFPVDNSGNPDPTNTQTLMTYSYDGLNSVNTITVSDQVHALAPICSSCGYFQPGYAGDYLGITAHNGIVYTAWSDDRASNTSGTWQAYVSQESCGPIQNPTNWNTNQIVPFDVEITSGNTLVIPMGVTISMLPGKEIIVDPGATLIVDGTITNYCSGLWGGIQINGNTSLTQTSANQGTVILNAGSTIEYALTGIKTSSGIILAYGTSTNYINFYNNQSDVQFSPYTNPSNSRFNRCTFNYCDFNVDANFPYNQYSLFLYMVTLNGVHGINFSGNIFENKTPVSLIPNATKRSCGICCFDATCNIGTCARICLLGCCGFPNTFKGLGFGITAYNTNPANNITIMGNNFEDNYDDINIGTMNNLVISDKNIFTKTTNDGTFGNPLYNIYLTNCTGYNVSNNQFSNNYYNNSYGTIIDNSGKTNNLINNNSFSDIYVQCQAQGTNGTYPYAGLQYWCNDYNQDGKVDDEFGADIAVASGLIAQEQGVFFSTNGLTTANNEFNYICSNPIRFNLYTPINYLTDNYWLDYSWANNSTNDAPQCHIGPNISLNPCPGLTADCSISTYTINVSSGNMLLAQGIDYHSALRNQKQYFMHERDSLKGILAKGNTKGLYHAIATQAANVVQDSLLAPGPVLSDSILQTAAVANLPVPILANVLLPNAVLDSSVVATLDSLPLPDTLVTSINTYQSTVNISPREMLKFNINYFQAMMDYTDNALITAFLTDSTIINPYDSAEAVIESDQPTLPLLAQLASLQWAAGEDSGALATLDSLHNIDYDSTYSNYCIVLPILINLQNNSNGYTALNGNSQDSAILEQIAMDSLKPGYTNARAVLTAVYNQQFDEPIIPLDLNQPHSSKKKNNLFVTTDNRTSTASSFSNKFSLFPNPANNKLTIQYNLDKSVQNAYIELFDEFGEKVETWQLPTSQTKLTENIATLSTGFYLYSIYADNKVVQRGKLIISR